MRNSRSGEIGEIVILPVMKGAVSDLGTVLLLRSILRQKNLIALFLLSSTWNVIKNPVQVRKKAN